MTLSCGVHRAIQSPDFSLWLACILTVLIPNNAVAEERYLASNPTGSAMLTLIGIVDGTSFSVTDLDAPRVIVSDSLDRFQVVEVDATDLYNFELSSSAPLLAYLGYDCCAVGGSTFVPTEDGHSRVGRAFVLFLPVLGPNADLFIFAIEEARVSLAAADGSWIDGREIRAGGVWRAYPIVGARPYLVRSTGDIAIMLSAVNGLTTVPPAQREASCDNDVGHLFYLATHSWGTGAIAVFAYDDSEITVSPYDGSPPVADLSLDSGSWFFMHELWRKTYRVESTGNVAVWAGDLEGGSMIGDMGDDFSFNVGRNGNEIVVHSQNHGATVFAPYDATVVSFRGEEYVLDAGQRLELEAGLATRVTANQPVVAMTYGGNDLNDWGGFLRPAPPLTPAQEGCPRVDADIPDWPDAGDAGSPDADLDEVLGDSDLDGYVGVEADHMAPDAESRLADYPRGSCDCASPGQWTDGRSGDASAIGGIVGSLFLIW